MPLYVVCVAIVNLGIGFLLAVSLGAAPGLAHTKNPLLAKILAKLPKKKAKAAH